MIWQAPEPSAIVEAAPLPGHGVLIVMESGNVYVVPIDADGSE